MRMTIKVQTAEIRGRRAALIRSDVPELLRKETARALLKSSPNLDEAACQVGDALTAFYPGARGMALLAAARLQVEAEIRAAEEKEPGTKETKPERLTVRVPVRMGEELWEEAEGDRSETRDAVVTYVPEIEYGRIESIPDGISEPGESGNPENPAGLMVPEGEICLEPEKPVTLILPFPSVELFREMTAVTLDELPEVFFKDLSGGVIVDERRGPSRYPGTLTMGEYRVWQTGRQVCLYYGSFRQMFPDMDYDALLVKIRKTVRHEFRHHLESLAGMHGTDSLEAEDRRQIRAFLDARKPE